MAVHRDCLYCAKRFEAKLTRRIFCSNACRARYNRERSLSCFYCGEVANTKEHITPQSVMRMGNGETVRACADCNSCIGATCPVDLEERVQTLIERFTRRFKLTKTIPEWDDEEISELGPALKRKVRQKIYERQRAINRVLYMEGVLRVLIRTSHVERLEDAINSLTSDDIDRSFSDE